MNYQVNQTSRINYKRNFLKLIKFGTRPTNEDNVNFEEAVVNLFMKLQALNHINFDYLGFKLKEIQDQI